MLIPGLALLLKNCRAVSFCALPHHFGDLTAVQRTVAMPLRAYSRQYSVVEKTISIIVWQPLLL